ncbi:MAG: GNAT family N-acetyltransferase [Deltaproteobacteria bacterium]|nr:GNAT family N-acetyltransferase [Deltaproteobacteria bacterium]
MDVRIRKAAGGHDAVAIADLLRSLGWFAHIGNESADATRYRVARHLGLCNMDNSHTVYVAEDDAGEIVGYCAVHWLPYLMLAGPEGYVSELFLRESCRGLGIGGRLLETVKTEAQKRGCARLMLLNMRHRDSYKRGFYKKQGWQERPEAINFVYPGTV